VFAYGNIYDSSIDNETRRGNEMQNLTHTKAITEGKAMDAIFDACRANEKRLPKNGVSFVLLANGNHQACLRDSDGVVVALAEVDALDC
jgi:hypothetical protein